jgi:DNA-binding transcriptional ArsR family regulator
VSAKSEGYSEPWAGIAKNRLLPNGRKEDILNLIAEEPKTISQLADALGLSAPTVYMHIHDMLQSELVREAVGRTKSHPAEKYFEPNFPVIKAREAAELCKVCDELAAKVADLFKKQRRLVEKAYSATSLAKRGWDLPEVAQYVYATMQRGARERLEQDGTLAPRKMHQNGVEWVFWAEQPKEPGDE